MGRSAPWGRGSREMERHTPLGKSKREGCGERDRPEPPPETALEGPARRGAGGANKCGAGLELYGGGLVVH